MEKTPLSTTISKEVKEILVLVSKASGRSISSIIEAGILRESRPYVVPGAGFPIIRQKLKEYQVKLNKEFEV